MALIRVQGTERFIQFTRELAQTVRVDWRRVVRSEGASVLRVAASMERIAKIKDIKLQTNERVMHRQSTGVNKMTINTGKRQGERGFMWFTDGRAVASRRSPNHGHTPRFFPIGVYQFGANTFFPTPYRFPDVTWESAKLLFDLGLEKSRKDTAAGLRARGVTTKSWVEMLEAIPGQTLEATAPKSANVPSFVKNALSRRGPRRQGFAVVGESTSGPYTVTCINTSPIAVKRGGQQKIEAAIRIREGAFIQALRHGVFDDAKALAQHYPGLTVSAA